MILLWSLPGFYSRVLTLLTVILLASCSHSDDQAGNKYDGRTYVSALGRLEPESEVVDISGPTGSRLDTLLVTEGSHVSAGDELAHLEGYAQRLAARNRADILLSEGKELHDSETLNGKADVEEANLSLSQIKTLSPLEIKAQQAVVNRTEGDLENAKRSLKRLDKLKENSSVTDQAVDDQHTVVMKLEEDLANARFNLKKTEAARDFDHLMAVQKLNKAKATLESALIGTHLKSLGADLALAEADLEQTIIRAPFDGVVLKILTRPGEKIDTLPILKLGNIDQMYAVAEVYETDIKFVKPGMKAFITSPAFDGRITGTVEHLSPLIFKNDVIDIDPASRVDARVVEVRIKLDDSKSVSHLSNLQVHVDIKLDQDTDNKQQN